MYEVIGEKPRDKGVGSSSHVKEIKLTPNQVTLRLEGAAYGLSW